MAKYCHTYDVMCSCPTCLTTDCARSDRTRLEAAVAHGAAPQWRGRPTPPRRLTLIAAAALAGLGMVIAIPAAMYLHLVLGLTKGDGPPAAPGGEAAVVYAVAPASTPAIPPASTPAASNPAPPATVRQPVVGMAPVRDRQPRRVIATEELRRLNDLKNLGNDARVAGNLEQARAHYRQAITQNPQYYEGFNNLANTYSEEGQVAEADRLYRQGLAVEPQVSHLHFNRGLNYYRAGHFAEAHRAMLLVLDLNPDDAEALFLAGQCASQLGQLAEAQRLYTALVARHPRNVAGHAQLAVLYEQLGESGISRAYLAEARTLSRRARNPGMY